MGLKKANIIVRNANDFKNYVDYVGELEQKVKKQQQVIDKATEWVRDWTRGTNDWFEEDSKPSELLDILKEK